MSSDSANNRCFKTEEAELALNLTESDLAPHIPVLAAEVLDFLAPALQGDAPKYLDGTLGFAGHARLILAHAAKNTALCGLDRDSFALNFAKKQLAMLTNNCQLFQDNYSNFAKYLELLNWSAVNAMLLDLGVSSAQLDLPERGFSFLSDAPLDMRMDQRAKLTAKEIVNSFSYAELRACLVQGEEPLADNIAKAIIKAREKQAIKTTLELVKIIESALPRAWRGHSRKHPATRTFQALRMAVNNELGELRAFLDSALAHLASGGRLAIISFHSLEDRLVKQAMRKWAKDNLVELLTKKPLVATDAELKLNPRASSAKLRAIVKI